MNAPLGQDGTRKLEARECQPAITERDRTLAEKRKQLARVLKSLKAPNVRPGIAKELRRHVAILEQTPARAGAITNGTRGNLRCMSGQPGYTIPVHSEGRRTASLACLGLAG